MARAANPNLQQDLVDAATVVFAQSGLATARVSDITARAGVSKGAFYLHFESKEALYLQIARGFLDEMLAVVADHEQVFHECAMRNFGVPSPDDMSRLHEADQHLLDFLWNHRQPLAMVLHGAMGTSLSFLADEFVDSLQKRMRDAMATHLPTGADEFLLSPDFTSMMAAGTIYMYARRMVISDQKPNVDDDLRLFRQVLITGVQAHCVQMLMAADGQDAPPSA
jgi:AcrR family transcriptional regulator